MIYTVTFNPAIDYVINEEKLDYQGVNKISNHFYQLGGKGINASILLNNLKNKNLALFFTSGNVGEMIKTKCQEEDIHYLNFNSGFESRINVKVNTLKNNFEINQKSNQLNKKEFKSFLNYLKNNLTKDDYLLIMGSYDSFGNLEKLVKIASKAKSKIILDIASNDLLKIIKSYSIFFIKPNQEEFEEILNLKNLNKKQIIIEAKKILDKTKLINIAVSQGSKGSIFVNKENIFEFNLPKTKIVNPVGAGDSFVAGFLSHYIQTSDYKKSFYFANACGIATAKTIGIAKKEKILKIYKSIKI